MGKVMKKEEKMKRIIALFLVFISVFIIVAGCATMKKSDIQFTKKTPIAIVGEGEVDDSNQKLVEIFKSSLSEELLKRGFIIVDDGDKKDVIVVEYRIRWNYLFPVNGIIRLWVDICHRPFGLVRPGPLVP